MPKKEKKIKVIELFAWVGWFRVWLERNKSKYEIVWSNQWEPSTKIQHASIVYEKNFWRKNHSNQDIETVETSDIPDHDMLVGWFPCQDYSVATTLKNSKWLLWKKGVLWWSIHRIISEKKNKPSYLFLENVDRLLKSPAKQRWRDFAVMLKSLDELGYAVEWRVINAADYWMPQRRRRIFILGYYKTTKKYKEIQKLKENESKKWIMDKSVISKAFWLKEILSGKKIKINCSLEEISKNFNKDWKNCCFENSGVFINWVADTFKTIPYYQWKKVVLWDILEKWKVDKSLYIDSSSLEKWKYLKWGKKEIRKTQDGFEYHYSEGGMVFPDNLEAPSRTIITWEWGASPSRFKHVVKTKEWLRRLTPIELERLNMFPDNHTKIDGISDTKRAFFMGNALVVGVIERIWNALFQEID